MVKPPFCAWCPLTNRRKTGCEAELFLKNPKKYFEGFLSGASRISRVWGRHSPTRFPQGQNERKANFGTAVESCSEKLRRSPAPVLSANKTVQEGISARSFGISRNFSCSLPTTPRKPEKADNGSIFSLIPSTDRKRILPTAAAIFPFAFSYWGFSKTPNGNEKKQQIR
jgi:hypothetical protein